MENEKRKNGFISGKRRAMWIGFAAVLLPLTVLLGLQYRWLVELEENSQIARKASVEKYLGLLADRIGDFYIDNASKGIDIPAYLFIEKPYPDSLIGFLEKRSQPLEEVENRDGQDFRVIKKPIKGVSLIFVNPTYGPNTKNILFFDPRTQSTTNVPEELYVTIKLETMIMESKFKSAMEQGEKSVDFQIREDYQYPMIIYPLVKKGTFVGLAGMVLDLDYFSRYLVPDLVCASISEFTEGEAFFQLRDSRAKVIFKAGKEEWASEKRITHSLAPIFPSWEMAISGDARQPQNWARGNFLFNISLSAVLALVLMSGIGLALRTASREMKLSEMKSDFVSNVSHELRTPLASIRAFGELLRLGKFRGRDKACEYGEYIETESRRLTRLINNILDFSKIESGQKSYRMEPCDLEELIERSLKTFSFRVQQENITIDFHRPIQHLPPVHLDPGAMTQAFSNLVDNAIKYANGSRHIEIKLYREQSKAIIAVKDQGIGIAADEIDKIFDRFHRVGTGLVHDVKGNGLGLAIVKHIVEAHRGKVRVESELNAGSTFSLCLPLEKEEPETSPETLPYTSPRIEET